MEHALAHFLSKFTYLAIIATLAAAGLGVPVSEDLTLLLGGGLAARGVTELWPTLASAYMGVLLGDLLIQHWGRRIGPTAYAHPLVRKYLSPERQERLRHQFARHGFLTVVVGRHIPMLRAPIFFLAGASQLPLWKFALADGLAAAVTVPIVVSLGYKFGQHLDDIRKTLTQFEWAIGAAVAAVALIWFLVRRRRRTGAERTRAPPPGP